METMGRRLRHLRKSHGLTQKELAEKAGITIANLKGLERSNTRVKAKNVVALARFFHISTDWIFFGLPESSEHKNNEKESESPEH